MSTTVPAPKGWKGFVSKQKRVFREQLIVARKELSVAKCPDSDANGDAGDLLVHQAILAEHVARCDRLQSQIAILTAALARIEKGTYGMCACGGYIPVERLKAVPFATTHIECAPTAKTLWRGSRR